MKVIRKDYNRVALAVITALLLLSGLLGPSALFSAESLRIPLNGSERIKDNLVHEIFDDIYKRWKDIEDLNKRIIRGFQDEISRKVFDPSKGGAREYLIFLRESSLVNRTDTVIFEFDSSIKDEMFYEEGPMLTVLGEIDIRKPSLRRIIIPNGEDKEMILRELRNVEADVEVIYEKDLNTRPGYFYHAMGDVPALANIISTRRLLSVWESGMWELYRSRITKKLYGPRAEYVKLGPEEKNIINQAIDYFLTQIVVDSEADEKEKKDRFTLKMKEIINSSNSRRSI